MQAKKPWIHLLGTDTDVGKTWVCRLLATPGFLTDEPVVAVKPFHSDWPKNKTWGCDFLVHGDHVTKHPVEVLNHIRLEHPMSPQGAGKLEGISISMSALNSWKSSSEHALSGHTVFCEGIGGICCPIAPGWTYLEWLAEHKEPCILVCRVGLGTLNHTIMSARLLKASGVPLKAIILNEEKVYDKGDPVRENCLWELEQQIDIPLIGPLLRDDLEQNLEQLKPLKEMLAIP